MKVIIFGLGNFGTALSLLLQESGNEVIAVDKNMDRVIQIKDQVAHAVCIDATNEMAFASLPLTDTDLAVVAIGENEGAAIIATAILKRYSNIRIISRSISAIHDTVLQAMGVDEIVHPEQEAAERLTRRLNLKKVIDNFEVDEKFSISKIKLPPAFAGQTIGELSFRQRFRLNIITIMRKREKKKLFGRRIYIEESLGLPTPETRLHIDDTLVVFGTNVAIEGFCAGKDLLEDF